MLVVGAHAVDPQPHATKKADDDRGDWPIQHLSAVKSVSLASDIRCVLYGNASHIGRYEMSHMQAVAKPGCTSRSTDRPIPTAGHNLHSRFTSVVSR
jgi:hypothetical protein